MKKNRKRALSLLVALLLSMAPAHATQGDVTPPELPEIPVVTVVGTKVTGDKYFEVGLKISAKQFQSVGAVLSYDNTLLAPVDWSAGAEIPVNNTEWSAVATPPTVLHTKGVDSLSGKPALACKGKDTAEGVANTRSYLYLGADALAYTALDDVQVVTVRFAYTEKALTESKPPITMPTGSEDKPGTEAFTIDFAPADSDIVKNSIPGAQLVVTTDADTAYTLGIAGYSAKFQLVKNGESINTGGGSGDFAITFLDWDGKIIDARAVGGDATDAVKTFTAGLRDPKAKAPTFYTDDASFPLTNKHGYAFDCWLDFKEIAAANAMGKKDTPFTSNKDSVANNVYAASFADVKTNMVVQAAYTEIGGVINTGLADATAVHYSVKPTAYTRYGAALTTDGKFSITLTVKRRNSKDNGVTRAVTPGVVVKMQPTVGGQPIYTLLKLENTDVTTCEVVPNKQISSVEYYFIDVNTAPANWPGAGNLSPNGVSIPQDGDTGFKCLCTLGYINNMALDKTTAAAEWANAIDMQTFADAGLSYATLGLSTAQTRLLAAIRAADRALTKSEMQTAINKAS